MARAWLLVALLSTAGLTYAAAPSVPQMRYSTQGADTCLVCHRDAVTLSVFDTRHGRPSDRRTPFGDGQLQCEACHGPGGAHADNPMAARVITFAAETPADIDAANAQCRDCHRASVGEAGFDAHGDELCSACHTSHPGAGQHTVSYEHRVETCLECHPEQRVALKRPFVHALDDGKMDCGTCHSVHRAPGEAALKRSTLNDTCYECHAEMRGPFLWEHAPVAEDCSSCHAVHGSSHPGMLTFRGPFLCQACHAQEGHPSLAAVPGGLIDGARSPNLLVQNCANCHSQVHGSNHPSGARLMR